jgi:hypothetical protein
MASVRTILADMGTLNNTAECRVGSWETEYIISRRTSMKLCVMSLKYSSNVHAVCGDMGTVPSVSVKLLGNIINAVRNLEM